MFGANNKPFGSTTAFDGGSFGSSTPIGQGGVLFGAATQPTGSGLFGQPSSSFGTPASTSCNAFGGFGTTSGSFGAATSSTQGIGGLFPDSTSAFGAPDQKFGGFGTTNTEPEVQVVPIETASIDERRDQFYESLDKADILILRVINDTLLDNFKLIVLFKGSDATKLDDLSIIMFLPKTELELIGENLQSNDLIRAAVNSVCVDERKIYVTVNVEILEDDADSEYLGKLSEDEVSFYLGDLKMENCYVKINLDKLVELRNSFMERMNGIQTT